MDGGAGLSPLERAVLTIRELRARLDAATAARHEPVAVVGLACRFPGGAEDPAAFWRLLRDGVDAVGEVPAERFDAAALYDPDPDRPGRIYTRHGAFLRQADRFDPELFGIAPREARAMDPQQRLVLEVAWEALEHAGLAPDRLAGVRGGVFLGAMGQDFARLAADPAAFGLYDGTGQAASLLAGRLAHAFGLGGPALTLDTSCSSSLVAVHLAVQSLRRGESDLALAGGVNLILAPHLTVAECRVRMLAPDGRCKTFDAAADGFVRGEGCGLVVLKRLSDARAAGDRIHAVVRGSAVNHDGRASGLTVPNELAQEGVIRQALADARLAPADVGYVEAHGTGTALGDPIEVGALARVFGAGRSRESPLVIGSVKTNVGHLEGAAGVAGLIKAVLAVEQGEIPPHLHFSRPNPAIPWEGWPVEVPGGTGGGRAWPGGAGVVRRAGVSSFGASGTNAHVVVEEAGSKKDPGEMGVGEGGAVGAERERPVHLLALSARTPEALAELAGRWAEHLEGHPELAAGDVAHTALVGRSRLASRLAVVGADAAELAAGLRAVEGKESGREGVWTGRAPVDAPPVALLFTGQGSQYRGMGEDLEGELVFRQALDRCCAVLDPVLGVGLREVLWGPGELLEQTRWVQPALVALEWSLSELWRSWGVEAAAVMGHSVGELTAAVVAGVLDLEAGLRFAAERGRRMQEAPGRGGMLAVSAGESEVADLLGPDVGVAAVNGRRQVVLSGWDEALSKVGEGLRARSVESRRLPVSHGFHSVQMDGMLDGLGKWLGGVELRRPDRWLVSGVTGAPVGEEVRTAEYWRRQAREPVRFAAGIEHLWAAGYRVFLEVGPQPTLVSLGRRTVDAGGSGRWLASLRRGAPGVRTLLSSLGELFVAGLAVDGAGLDRGRGRRRLALPTYPFERQPFGLRPPGAPAGPPAEALPTARSLPGAFTDLADVLYRLDWRDAGPAGPPPAPPALAHLATSALEAWQPPFPPARWAAASRELEELARVWAWEGLGPLFDAGAGLLPGRAEPGRGRLLDRLRHLAAEGASLAGEDRRPAAERTAAARLRHPEIAAELDLLARCGPRLGEVLQGAVDPLELLFPGGDLDSAGRLYREAPGTAALHRVLAAAVAAQVAALPAGARLRVLEVGGGTGASTDQVLSVLPAERSEYLFTDLGAGFVAAARERYRHLPFVRCAPLDLEADPASQGVAAGGFDLVLAANVVHATRDLRRSLSHLKQTLAPGGLLVLLEGTAAQGWLDLTFGLTEGWWRFADADLRADSPLLAAAAWERLLCAEGFAEALALEPAGESAVPRQAVVLARGPGAAPRHVLLLADGEASGRMAEALARRFAELEHRITRLEADELIQAADPAEALAARLAGAPPLDLAVHLGALDGTSAEDLEAGALGRALDRGLGGALRLVQALAGRGTPAGRPPRVCFVSRCAVAAGAGDAALSGLAQAPLWGLARVAAEEHPELRPRALDLGEEGADADPAAVVHQLLADDGEGEVALRGGRRVVARLVRAAAPEAGPIHLGSGGAYLVVGGFSGLGREVAGWLADRGVRRLALAGRRGAPQEAEPWLAELRGRGVTVGAFAVDVGDGPAVARLVAEVEAAMGPLAGVVQGAGVLRDGLLAGQPWEDFAAVARAKVLGTWHLLAALGDRRLELLLLLSSAAAVVANPGQASHAAANAFLDAVAQRCRAAGTPALAVGWGAVAGVGAAAREGVTERLARRGIAALGRERIGAVLDRLLAAGHAHALALPVDWRRYPANAATAARFAELLPAAPEPAAAGGRTGRPLDLSARPGRGLAGLAGAELRAAVAERVAAVLGLETGRIDPGAGFFQLGMDSLTSLELRHRLQRDLELELPATAVFDHPTVQRLAEYLAQRLPAARPTVASAAPAPAVRPAAAEPLAIVGLGCRFPGADGPEAFWRLLLAGEDPVREIPGERFAVEPLFDPEAARPGTLYARQAALLDRVDGFDPRLFGISPREAESLDPQHRLLLEVAWEAFEEAGLDPFQHPDTGVYVGICTSDYAQLLHADPARLHSQTGTGAALSAASGRLSFTFGFSGPSLSVNTACSSSLVAVHLACRALCDGECRVAVAGGVSLILTPDISIIASQSRMLSPDGRCKAFAAEADGYGRGEGCGLVVLKRLSDARADGDRIHAVVRGTALNQDGRTSGLTVPSGPAQQRVVRAALDQAGVAPAEVDYVEAHGTGTQLGDPIEIGALAAVFGERPAERPLLVGSVKTNIGHLEGAAGVAGLIKTVLALERGAIPAQLHFRTPSPHVAWSEIPLRVTAEAAPWPDAGRPRRAGVSSFGMSGTNAHVVVEQAPPEAEAVEVAERPAHLLTLSARTPEALAELAGRWADHLERHPEMAAADVAHTALAGRSRQVCRLALVAPDTARMAAGLRAVQGIGAWRAGCAGPSPPVPLSHPHSLPPGEGAPPPEDRKPAGEGFPPLPGGCECGWERGPGGEGPVLITGRAPAEPPPLAFLFTGRGFPYRGMGEELERVEPVFRQALDRCAALLDRETGRSLREVLPGIEWAAEPDPGEEQAACVALEWSLAQLWISWGLEPGAVLGHGVGELTATVVAGDLSLDEALRAAAAGGHGRRDPAAFAAGLGRLWSQGYRTFLEMAPGPDLVGAGQRAVDPGGEGRWLASLRRDAPAVRSLLAGLGVLFTAGAPVDGRGLARGRQRRRLALPTYPFQRERYWVEPAPRLAAPRGPARDWLPGRRLAVAGDQAVRFETRLAADDPAFLSEHRVQGVAVVPAAVLALAALGAAGRLWPGREAEVAELAFERMLALPDGEARLMQTVLRSGPAGAEVEILSCRESDLDLPGAAPFEVHARGRLQLLDDAPPIAPPEAAPERAARVAAEDYYDRVAADGIDLGPAFRALGGLWRQGDAAGGSIHLNGLGPGSAGPAGLPHPVVLDAAFQLAGLLLGEEPAGAPYVPVALRGLRLRGGFGAAAVARVERGGDSAGPAGPGRLQVALRLDAEGGRLEVGTLTFQPLAPAGPRPVPAAPEGEAPDVLFEVAWRPRLRPGAVPDVPAPEEIARRLRPGLAAAAERGDLGRYAEALQGLDQVALAWIARGVRALGWSGEGPVPDALGAGLPPARRRWLRRAATLLAAADGPGRGAAEQLAARLIAEHPEVAAELELLRRCGPRLAAVLRGEADPLELLFPDGDDSLASSLYGASPAARAMNAAVGDVLAQVAAACPPGRTLRILEVGAGTGSTTAAVLPRLDPDRTSYAFTDVGPLFLARARERFHEFPCLAYRRLDLAEDPGRQGFDEAAWDVVLAANVLHALPRVSAGLEHVRRLLAPGGLLVLLETLRPQPWVDLTFGLTDGWWSFADDRRDHPLLDADGWRATLARAGFEEPSWLGPEQAAPVAHLGVLLARRPAAAAPRPRRSWWLVADRAGIAAALAERLETAGDACRVIADASPHLEPDGTSPDAVVHLAALDAAGGEQTADEVEALCRSALATVQELAALPSPRPPELWWVTRGAVPAPGPERPSDPAIPGFSQSALWGLGRVLRLEHADQRCVCLDLDPAAAPERQAEALARELRADDDGEDQIAWRGAQRLVPRLVRRAPEGPDLPLPEQPSRLVAGAGSLDELRWAPLPAAGLAPGEVAVRVRACGLNFKDLLHALGALPGGALGLECAGEVEAVAPDVGHLAPGDRVLALAAGCLAERLVVDARRVLPIGGLDFEAAVTLSSAFLTAVLALERLGRLQAGERVLVHAAAGGVGQAAMQVARRLGAEVLATASPGKWAALRAQGVERVASSRSLDFAAAWRGLEGGVDLVLNSLTSEGFVAASLSLLRPGGRFVEIARRGAWTPAQVAAARPDVEYHLLDAEAVLDGDPEGAAGIVREVLEGVAAGVYRPLPRQVFAAPRAAEAFRQLQQARQVGKVVVRIDRRGGPRGGTCLIAGGLGGLGLLTADWLHRQGVEHLVLAGRRAPSEEAERTIAALRRGGARVEVVSLDATDGAAVERLVAEIDAGLPPLRAVVHAAGVLADGVASRLPWPDFARVLGPKVRGAWHLHRATLRHDLDHFVLFGAAAGLLGNPGQANHAAANELLAGLAAHRRSRGLPAVCIDWGVVGEVGEAARRGLDARLDGTGVGALSPAAVRRVLAAAFGPAPARLGAIDLDPALFRRSRPSPFLAELAPPAAAPAPPPAAPAADWRRAPAAERRRHLVDRVAAEVAAVLSLTPAEVRDSSRRFFDLGLDSLTSLELRNRLSRSLGCALPATFVFQYATVRELADHLAEAPEEGGSPAGRSEAPADGPGEGAEGSDGLFALSEEEIARLLAAELDLPREGRAP